MDLSAITLPAVGGLRGRYKREGDAQLNFIPGANRRRPKSGKVTVKLMFAALAAAAAVLIAGCAGTGTVAEVPARNGRYNKRNICSQERDAVYVSISAKRAKQLMDSESDYVVLDVRTPEEYADGHIKARCSFPIMR